MRRPPADARSARARGDCILDIARFANPFVVPLTFPTAIFQEIETPLLCGINSWLKLQLYSAKLWRGNDGRHGYLIFVENPEFSWDQQTGFTLVSTQQPRPRVAL